MTVNLYNSSIPHVMELLMLVCVCVCVLAQLCSPVFSGPTVKVLKVVDWADNWAKLLVLTAGHVGSIKSGFPLPGEGPGQAKANHTSAAG